MSPEASSERRPLVIRLRNWVGDVVLSVPTLLRLEAAGYRLHVLGRGWAPDLLRGFGWDIGRLEPTFRGRVRQLRELRRRLGGSAPAMVFPYSFSSAFEFALAGMPAWGFRSETRGWLLARSVGLPSRVHTLEEYWALGQAFLGVSEAAPDGVRWSVHPEAQSEADRLVAANSLGSGYAVICPFSGGGTVSGQDKRWPHFPEFAASLAGEGVRIVICPGSPGEEKLARERYPDALALPGVGMGVYAALLKGARLVVSNDTGPGHLAAVVGAPLVSVIGATPLWQWRALGPSVHIEQGWPEWPAVGRVLARSRSLLAS